ncbi:hypothetical protein [Palleronia abyssalis]|uniref:Uncharacterized protein n=1 Tax=Palleronia abyssalis TaxID=1501240 RepID=A0A2R8BR08_9RHOB|nr:hypothetical protein [Palleronia abyssalis]SPJ22580.1 hypothetical protein PAA8504_00375 [Palleronia abyssalis]
MWRAAHVVLAAGGVENARLLLLSDTANRGGLGNGADQVGRGFVDHAFCYAGHFELAPPAATTEPHIVERADSLKERGGAIAAFMLNPALRRREGLNGAGIFLMHRASFQLHTDYEGPGGRAITYFAEMVRRERFIDRSALSTVADLGRNAPAAARLRHAVEAARPRPRLALRMQVETSPSEDSRVILTKARDRLGRRRARVT